MTMSVGVGVQAADTFVTAVAPGTFINALSYEVTPDNQIQCEPTIGQRGKLDPTPGDFVVSWKFAFELRGKNAGPLLGALFGDGSDTAAIVAGADYSHTFKMNDAEQWLTLTFAGKLAASQEKVTGAFVEQMDFSYEKGGKCIVVEVSGKGHSYDIEALAAATFDTTGKYTGHHADLQIGAVGATASDTAIESLKLTIKRRWELHYAPGSREPVDADMLDLEITGSIDRRYDDLTQHKYFLGAAAATTPAATLTAEEMDIDLDTGVDMGGGTTYQLDINLKNIYFHKRSMAVKGRDRHLETYDFEAYVPSAGEQITVVYYNLDNAAYV